MTNLLIGQNRHLPKNSPLSPRFWAKPFYVSELAYEWSQRLDPVETQVAPIEPAFTK